MRLPGESCHPHTRLGTRNANNHHAFKAMETTSSCTRRFVISSLAALGLNILAYTLRAQPVVSFTISGTSGAYTLDFTVNNATPGTGGFDIYFFGVLVDGYVSASPSGYNATTYNTVHQVEGGDIPN